MVKYLLLCTVLFVGCVSLQTPLTAKFNLEGCDIVKTFGNNNIAKESDHGGFVAVMVDKYNRPKLVTKKGKIYKLTYSGVGNPVNGRDRHHYRHKKAFADFPDNMTFRGNIKKKTTCYKIFNSGERHE